MVVLRCGRSPQVSLVRSNRVHGTGMGLGTGLGRLALASRVVKHEVGEREVLRSSPSRAWRSSVLTVKVYVSHAARLPQGMLFTPFCDS